MKKRKLDFEALRPLPRVPEKEERKGRQGRVCAALARRDCEGAERTGAV